jgi:pimeloyl-ACP methyl ester carboxylesterase
MVALSLAAIQPISVSHLVMINGSSRLSSPFERLAPHALRTLAQAARIQDSVARERLIHSLVTNGDEAQLTVWAKLAAELREGEVVRVAPVLRQLLAAMSFKARRVSQPALVLYGDGDRMVAPRCSQHLARHLGASSGVHPHAGHDLSLEEPAWVVEQIAEWLRLLAATPR